VASLNPEKRLSAKSKTINARQRYIGARKKVARQPLAIAA